MNKTKLLLFLSLLLGFSNCQENKKQRPANALETGRTFIKASLDGDFETASSLLLSDTQNIQLFTAYKEYYSRMSDEKKKHYKAADYIINKFNDLNDSTTIINYSNDYMNKPMDIKVVKINNEWAVDFKYTYSGNLSMNP
jgi:hypothetical protein